MTREQLEHIIRAAATIADDDEIIIVGSQAILGACPDAPAFLRISMEADVFPRHHPERADLIDGSIGEDSMFHETFGYYAQGVGPETAVLPEGWETRLVTIRNENTRGATGLALDPHDLAISKYVANREKDQAFLAHAVQAGILSLTTLRGRLAATRLPKDVQARIARQIDTHFTHPRPFPTEPGPE